MNGCPRLLGDGRAKAPDDLRFASTTSLHDSLSPRERPG